MTRDTIESNNNKIEVSELETGSTNLSTEVVEEDKNSGAANFILNFLYSGISYGTF